MDHLPNGSKDVNITSEARFIREILQMKKGLIIGLSVTIGLGLIAVAFIVMTMRNYIKAFEWDIHQNVTSAEKEKLSNLALMPDAADCIDYYSVMGMQDPSYLITSYAYGSVDEMCDALPEGCSQGIGNALGSGEYKETEDVLNVMVKRYEVSDEDLPLITEDDVPDQYSAAARGAFRYYYILEYKDGTYRFEMRVDEV